MIKKGLRFGFINRDNAVKMQDDGVAYGEQLPPLGSVRRGRVEAVGSDLDAS